MVRSGASSVAGANALHLPSASGSCVTPLIGAHGTPASSLPLDSRACLAAFRQAYASSRVRSASLHRTLSSVAAAAAISADATWNSPPWYHIEIA